MALICSVSGDEVPSAPEQLGIAGFVLAAVMALYAFVQRTHRKNKSTPPPALAHDIAEQVSAEITGRFRVPQLGPEQHPDGFGYRIAELERRMRQAEEAIERQATRHLGKLEVISQTLGHIHNEHERLWDTTERRLRTLERRYRNGEDE